MKATVSTITRLLVGIFIPTTMLLAGTSGGPFVSGLLRGEGGDEAITGVGRLPNGDVVVCGYTDGTYAWDNAKGYRNAPYGSVDAFVAILSYNLDSVKAFTFFGGISDDKAVGLAIGPQGRIVIAGNTESVQLPISIGAVRTSNSGFKDGFIAVFSSDLSLRLSCTYFGGTADDEIKDVIVNDAGNIIISGATKSIYGFPTNNAIDNQHDGGTDAFVACLTSNLANINFSTYYGGTSDDVFNGIAVDDAGNIACVGTTRSADFRSFPIVDPLYWWMQKDRPFDWSYNGGDSDGILCVFSDDGARCIVATFFGGSDADVGTAAVMNSTGQITIIGTTKSSDIPVASASQQNLRGPSDIFISQFDPTGRTLIASTYFGGEGGESADGARYYKGDQFALFGTTTSPDIAVQGAGTRSSFSGGIDPFVSIVTLNSVSILSIIGGTKDDQFARALVEPDGGVVFVGTSQSPNITLDGKSLEGHGEPPTTDAFGIRLQKGLIQLHTPDGGKHFCEGQSIPVTWSKLDMQETDKYKIEASVNLKDWYPIADYMFGTSASVTISDQMFVHNPTTLRVVSSRGHTSRMEQPLTIDERPSITKQPESSLVCDGQNATVGVNANGYGLRYVWRKDGVVLNGKTSSTIDLGIADPSIDGRYDVVITSDCGITITSQQAYIRYAVPTSITSVPQDTTVVPGTSLVLSVTADGANLTYQWFFDDEEIPNETSRTLTLNNITSANAGRYFVVVNGACGTKTSQNIRVFVGTTGVDELSQQELSIYPNPASTVVYVNTNGTVGQLRLIDNVGNVVRELSFTQSNQTSISVADLPFGTYTLVVTTPTEMRIAFLVVVR